MHNYAVFAIFPPLLNVKEMRLKFNMKLAQGNENLLNEDGVCGKHNKA